MLEARTCMGVSTSKGDGSARASKGHERTVAPRKRGVTRVHPGPPPPAFAEMANEADAQAAMEALDGKELDGRHLNLNEARERQPRGGGGGGGRW